MGSSYASIALSTTVRLRIMLGALFLIYGVQLTYLPVWLDAKGLTAAQIAVASSAPMLLRLVITPSVAFLADRGNAHRRMILLLCWAALGLMLALSQANIALLVVALVIAMQVAVQTIMPLTDTITMQAVRAHGVDYGRVRMWGSATFILASYTAGFLVQQNGAGAVIALLIIGASLTTAAALLLPYPKQEHAAVGAPRLGLADVRALAADHRFLLFLGVAAAIQSSHAMFYVFGVLHWRAQGLSAFTIGTLWAIGVVAEIALFWWGRRLTWLAAGDLMLVGGAIGIVRWGAMALDPPAMMLWPLQVLHAGTYAATHLGTMQWIAREIPEQKAGTAQALLSTMTAGLGMGGAMLVTGLLYERFGGGAYLAMAVLCAVGVAAGLVLRRLHATAAIGEAGQTGSK